MLCSPNSLNFNGDATWCMQESGRRDAQNALAIGQENIAKSMKEWNADIEIQKAYPYIYDYIKAMHLK